jgi:hypothetical protein
MASRGYQPTKVAVVMRTVRVDRLISQGLLPATAVPAGTEISNEEGEIVFWSWNDGDDSTWEGITYVAKYTTGQWATYDSQISIPVPQYTTVWSQQTGGSIQEEHQDVTDRSRRKMDGFLQAIARPGDYGAIATPAAMSSQLPGTRLASPSKQDYQDFLVCSVGFCFICAEGCVFAGPFWPECFGLCCFLSVLFCGWYHLF